MARSKKIKNILQSLEKTEINRLVRMGWEDRTAFEAIQEQFDITPNDFVLLMRTQLSASDFKRWRRRVFEQGRLKNEKKSGVKSLRFKCSRQSVDGITKGWK